MTLNSSKSLRLSDSFTNFSVDKYKLYMLINYNNGMFHPFSNLSILKLTATTSQFLHIYFAFGVCVYIDTPLCLLNNAALLSV